MQSDAQVLHGRVARTIRIERQGALRGMPLANTNPAQQPQPASVPGQQAPGEGVKVIYHPAPP